MLIIPAIDLIDGKCVRLFQGDYAAQTTYSADPVGQARRFQSAGALRLHLVDLEGARAGAGKNREAIRSILGMVDIPVQVGGGIRKSEDVTQLLSWGVRFLILGTVALKQPEIVAEWIDRWGVEPFIVSLDLRGGRLQSEGWLEQSGVTVEAMAERISKWGIRQVICTDVEHDGTLEQPNYSTYVGLLGLLPPEVSLIAAGGVSSLAAIRKLEGLGVGGAIVGKALYEGKISLEDLAGAC